MIIEQILNLIYNALSATASVIPTIDFDLPLDIISGFTQIIYGLAYFFPLGDFLIIMGLYIMLINFRVVYNIARTIRSFLPF